MKQLEITITDGGIVNVAVDGRKIGMLKSVMLKAGSSVNYHPEVVIEAYNYEDMPPELRALRDTMSAAFPWLQIVEGELVKASA